MIVYIIVGIAIIIILFLLIRIVGFMVKIASICALLVLIIGVFWWQSTLLENNIVFVENETSAYMRFEENLTPVNITDQKIILYLQNCSKECIEDLSFFDILKNYRNIVFN